MTIDAEIDERFRQNLDDPEIHSLARQVLREEDPATLATLSCILEMSNDASEQEWITALARHLARELWSHTSTRRIWSIGSDATETDRATLEKFLQQHLADHELRLRVQHILRGEHAFTRLLFRHVLGLRREATEAQWMEAVALDAAREQLFHLKLEESLHESVVEEIRLDERSRDYP